MAEGAGDLLGQAVVQAVDQVADVVGDVAQVQVLPAAVAGVEDLPEVGQDLDDLPVARQRRVAQVMDRAAFLVGLDDASRDRRQRRPWRVRCGSRVPAASRLASVLLDALRRTDATTGLRPLPSFHRASRPEFKGGHHRFERHAFDRPAPLSRS